jgi:hypothetical protein
MHGDRRTDSAAKGNGLLNKEDKIKDIKVAVCGISRQWSS